MQKDPMHPEVISSSIVGTNEVQMLQLLVVQRNPCPQTCEATIFWPDLFGTRHYYSWHEVMWQNTLQEQLFPFTQLT